MPARHAAPLLPPALARWPSKLGAALLLGTALAAQDGKLDAVRDAVRNGHDSDVPHDYDDDFDDDPCEPGGHSLLDDTLGTLIAWTVQLPFWVPRGVLGDAGGDGGFAEYPYREGAGYWRGLEPRPDERLWSYRPRVELGTDFGDLERFGLALEVEHASRFGLDLAWNRWREELASGATDQLDLGDLNVVYRFAQGEHAAFRAGLGLAWLDDDRGQDLGFNTTYAAEFLPREPLTAAFELDLGTVGDATQQHARAELGFVLERFGLFASFDWFDIGGVQLRSYGLGLRGWF